MHVTLFVAFSVVVAALAVDTPAHEFHVTNGRMAVEGNSAVCEIRFFRHDLEDAVSRFHGRPEFRLTAGPQEDSLFAAYLSTKFEVRLNGTVVKANLSGSGEERVREEEMWWYRFNYVAPETIVSLDVRNRLLFELYDDQRNILRVQHFPSEQSATYYFVPDSDRRTTEFRTDE